MISCLKAAGRTSDTEEAMEYPNSAPDFGLSGDKPDKVAILARCKELIMAGIGYAEKPVITLMDGGMPVAGSPLFTKKKPCKVGDKIVIGFIYEPSSQRIRGLGHMVYCTIEECGNPIRVLCTNHPREGGGQYQFDVAENGKISGAGLDGGFVTAVVELAR
jgi:hypothetical protein